jgi:hypothetical protein
VNKAILDQYKAGSISVVSILSNMSTSAQLKNIKKMVLNQKLSLHVNLLRGKPISAGNEIPSIINEQGDFYGLPIFLTKLIFNKINLEEVEIEINNQLQKLMTHGIKPKYVDSEQHIHIFNPTKKIICKIAKENNLIIRSEKSTFSYLKYRFPKYQVVLILNLMLNLIHKKNTIAFKNYHAQIVHPGNNFD